MDFAQILSDIRKGQFAPVYLLHGEEAYFTEQLTQALLDHTLSESEREFDQSILYGRDTDVGQLIATAKRFPMVASRHVVLLREAQDLKKVESLEAFLATPNPTTILILAFKKKVDQRKKWFKSLSKDAVKFLSASIPPWKINDWVKAEASIRGLNLDSKSCAMIVEHLGEDLQRISKDLDKLKMIAKSGQKIDPASIQRLIGVSRDYNIFELQDAIMNRNAVKAQRIVKHFAANPRAHPIQPVIGALHSLYSRMILLHAHKAFTPDQAAKTLKAKPFYAKKVLAGAQRISYGKAVRNIAVLREYDLKSKGVGATNSTPQGELMKEMVFKLYH